MGEMQYRSTIALGITSRGKVVSYDERLYEFRLDNEMVEHSTIQEIDDAAGISWFYLEQRDWFKKLDDELLGQARKRVLSSEGGDIYEGMTPEERVHADSLRDDSILAGKIVEADPALVHAVVQAIEAEGLMSAASSGAPAGNPLARASLPKGMEALSQMERAHGDERAMTRAEKLLMKRILKNDDKEKRRREKHAEKLLEKGESSSSSDELGPSPEEASGNPVQETRMNGESKNEVSAGRFGAFVEKTMSRIDGSNQTVEEQRGTPPDKDTSKNKREAKVTPKADKVSRKEMKSQMDTVPGMKEAQKSKGISGFFSSLVKGKKTEG